MELKVTDVLSRRFFPVTQPNQKRQEQDEQETDIPE